MSRFFAPQEICFWQYNAILDADLVQETSGSVSLQLQKVLRSATSKDEHRTASKLFRAISSTLTRSIRPILLGRTSTLSFHAGQTRLGLGGVKRYGMVRLKTRYVLFEILYPQSRPKALDSREVLNAVRSTIQEYFGELGMGRCLASLVMKYYNQSTSTGIIRISREQAPIVQGALTYIRMIEGETVVIRVLHISGTIKKSEQRALTIKRAAVYTSR